MQNCKHPPAATCRFCGASVCAPCLHEHEEMGCPEGDVRLGGPRTGLCGAVHDDDHDEHHCFDCEYELVYRDQAEAMEYEAQSRAWQMRDDAMAEKYSRNLDYGEYLAWRACEEPPRAPRRGSFYDEWRGRRRKEQGPPEEEDSQEPEEGAGRSWDLPF